MTTRNNLYRLARLMGDMSAASRGPASLGRRVVRRQVYRRTNAVTRQVLRSLGLSR